MSTFTYASPPNYWLSDHEPTSSETPDSGDISLYDRALDIISGLEFICIDSTVNALKWLEVQISIKEDVVTLLSGTVTVSYTALAAGSKIVLLYDVPGTNAGAVFVSARTNGVGFNISSTNVLDDSVIQYRIFN